MSLSQEILGLVAALAAAAYPFARAYVQTKFTPERLAHVVDLARQAVRAAEKLSEDSVNGGATGDQKLTFASEFLVAAAKRLGLKLDTDEVLTYIHAALREMQQVEGTAKAVLAA